MTWTDKLVGSKEERAVSPVIGVILMVAITVILAAVIAAFVMDIGPGGSTVNAAVDVEVDNGVAGNDDGEVEFTVTDAGNADDLVIRGDAAHMAGSPDEISVATDITTGASYTVSQGTSNGDDFDQGDVDAEFRLVALADGNEQIVQTFEVEFDGS